MVLTGLLCLSLAPAAGASSNWSKTYGGAGNDIAFSVVSTSDGGYAIAGWTDSFGSGGIDFWLVKTDAFGNMQWNRTYGGPYNDMARALVATPDGGYAIAGTYAIWSDNGDFWLVKTDSLGNMQWNRTYDVTGDEVAFSLVLTSDGGYALAGSNALVKTDPSGNIEWNRTFGQISPTDMHFINSLVATSDGGYALGGSSASDDELFDFWLTKTDAHGNELWNHTYGGIDLDDAYSLIETSDGGFAIAGLTYSFGTQYGDFWLVKTDASGNMEWNKTYGGNITTHHSIAEMDCSLVTTSDGGYAIAGWTNSFSGYFGDFWLVKTDAFGNMEWNQTYPRNGIDLPHSLVSASDGGYAIAGVTYPADAGYESGDFWLIKTDQIGVVPEFSSWLIPSLMLTIIGLVLINKKRLPAK